MDVYRMVLVGIGLMSVVTGCMHSATQETVGPSDNALIARLDRGIMELNENLAHLRQHIAELDHMPATGDPLLQKLRALDLEAWRLHEQQWQLQLDHLKFTSDHIHRAQETRADKSRLRDEWMAQQREFSATLQQLRDKRHEFERQRLLVESQLVEQYFR